MPPSHYLVHMNINLLYQYWLHTELVDSLGPLESVLNTPSHHRVHHGSTKYCIDKNYGGVLIIWDRIFGTFAWERRDEPMVYGLIEQVDSFNPLYLQVIIQLLVSQQIAINGSFISSQLFYLGKVYDKFRSVSGFGNKLKAIFYGPGWFPGTPRLGDPDCLPEVTFSCIQGLRKIATWFIYLCLSFFRLLSAKSSPCRPQTRPSCMQQFIS